MKKRILKKKQGIPEYQSRWDERPLPVGQDRNTLSGFLVHKSLVVVYPSAIQLGLLKKMLNIPLLYGQEHGFIPENMEHYRSLYIPVNHYGKKPTQKTTEGILEFLKYICKNHDVLAVVTVGKEAYKWTYGEGYTASINSLVGNILFNDNTGSTPLIVLNDVDFLDHFLSIELREKLNCADGIEFDPESLLTQTADDREKLTVELGKVIADMMDSMHHLKEHLTI